jgi:hypothetical protein
VQSHNHQIIFSDTISWKRSAPAAHQHHGKRKTSTKPLSTPTTLRELQTAYQRPDDVTTSVSIARLLPAPPYTDGQID